MISLKPSSIVLIFFVQLFGCRDQQDSSPGTAHQTAPDTVHQAAVATPDSSDTAVR
jgi:hypothetical protein